MRENYKRISIHLLPSSLQKIHYQDSKIQKMNKNLKVNNILSEKKDDNIKQQTMVNKIVKILNGGYT